MHPDSLHEFCVPFINVHRFVHPDCLHEFCVPFINIHRFVHPDSLHEFCVPFINRVCMGSVHHDRVCSSSVYYVRVRMNLVHPYNVYRVLGLSMSYAYLPSVCMVSVTLIEYV